MGILDRLGNVIKSYINDEDENIFRRERGRRSPQRQSDPDLDAAWEELDDYLNGKDSGKSAREDSSSHAGSSAHPGSSGRTDASGREEASGERARRIPPELQNDIVELGLTPQASFEDCKQAYKKLLKIHHPDKHAQNSENLKKATEKTARINTAYRNLEKWFKSGL